MRALSNNDIESEISYAYLHAVASHAGMAVTMANRHADNNGIDATITAWGPFEGGGKIEEVDLRIQLKATVHVPSDDGKTLSYFLAGVNRYDDLRKVSLLTPRLLVVLFLPSESSQWLSCSTDNLLLRHCAYWLSLRGASKIETTSGTTVKFPKNQPFTPEELKKLAVRLSRNDPPLYIGEP